MAPLGSTWSWNQSVTNQSNAESLPVPVVGTFGEQFLNIFNETSEIYVQFLVWILDHLWYLNHHVYYFMLQFIICNFLWIFSSFLEFWEQMFPLNSYFCGLSDIWNVFIGNCNIVIVNLPVTPHIDTFLGCFKHHVRM